MIRVGTTYVLRDEPCLGLYEMHLQSPGSRGFHRYQILYVMRDDKPAEFRKDMGPVREFKDVDQLRIPGGAMDGGKFYIEHTVGELRDIADQIRGNPPFDKRELARSNRIKI